MKVAVFSLHKFEKDYLSRIIGSTHELTLFEVRLTAETVDLASGFDAVSIFVNDECSESILDRLAELGVRFIALRSAGYNHVALSHAHDLDIRVANVPAYSPHAVAEHTVALMLALNRKLVRAHNRVRELNFSLDGLVGFDMNGKTAGIIGLGKIGSIVARILHGFGCKLLGYDVAQEQHLVDQYSLQYTDLETLCRESDIITLHTPLLPETRYLIDEKRIQLMKPNVMVINTSRGGLLNTKDVIAGLKERRIGALGLDVYEEEKGLFFEDHSEDILQDDLIARLLTFQNVLITSHQAFLTDTALENIATITVESLNAWEHGSANPNEL